MTIMANIEIIIVKLLIYSKEAYCVMLSITHDASYIISLCLLSKIALTSIYPVHTTLSIGTVTPLNLALFPLEKHTGGPVCPIIY